MPTPIYTHDFSFEVDDAGGQFIKGELGFGTDKKAAHQMKFTATPLKHDTLVQFVEFIAYLEKIYQATGGIFNIQVKKK